MSKIIEFPSENDMNEDFRDNKYIDYIASNLDDCSYRIASEFIRCTDEEKTAIKVITCMSLLEAGYYPTNSANLSKFQIDCGIRVTGTIHLETFKNSLSYVEKFLNPDSEDYKDIKDLFEILIITSTTLLGITSVTSIWKGRNIKKTKIEEDI